MIETGLATVLSAYATAYPNHLPERRSLPAITYSRISTVRSQTHDGPTGLVAVRFQLTCHAATYLAAATLADSLAGPAASGGLNGYSGLMGATAVANVEIVNQVDLGMRPETESYQIAVDAIVHHQE